MSTDTATASSSRVSAAGAGWEACTGPGRWREDVPKGAKPLSWLRPATLWRARNDIVARHLGDPVDAMRAQWVGLARERADRNGAPADFVFRLGDADADSISLLVAGDTGEGDASQYAVVPGLLSQAGGVAAAVICSDVIYPAGEINDYRDKFFSPYRALRAPVLAMPGNHDWYDGLHGFMSHLCGIDADAGTARRPGCGTAHAPAVAPRRARTPDLEDMRRLRSAPEQVSAPAAGPVLGDGRRPAALRRHRHRHHRHARRRPGPLAARVSRADRRPKVLLTGKPIYVNNELHLPIAGGGTVDDIVRDPAANYVAAIGGDIHNYQRYPVTLSDGRRCSTSSRAAGARSCTPRTRSRGSTSRARARTRSVAIRCGATRWPATRASTTAGSPAAGNALPDAGRGRRRTWPTCSGSTRRAESAVALSLRARVAAKVIQPAPAQRGFQRLVSEAFDWNEPPLFKSFLRLDASRRALRVRCFGVSGCAGTEDDPPVEDEFTIGW